MTATRALLGAFSLFVLSPLSRADDAPKVSYYKDVRPILATHCNGCHQPAKPLGGYLTTSHAELFKSGERGKAGVVKGKPESSYLVEQIKTPDKGKSAMPKGRDPLTTAQVKLISDWIKQGATDDTPASAATVPVDAANPPKYAAPPVVTSLAYSPDGSLLAVTGYHEVLLYKPETGKLDTRLIGLSERIQSVAFNPKGTRLAAVGGSPGRFGEVQVWDFAKEKLTVSAPFTFDTLYGGSWSPDGTLVAFGAADNIVRAIDAGTGKQTLQMGTHSDWVLGTVFSQDGLHVASVGRDMSMKLTEVPTQRFVDNVTSITPGALKGGLMALDRRPVPEPPGRRVIGSISLPGKPRMQKVPPDAANVPPKPYDELLAAGSDGVARMYKMHREAVRQIGDDANKVKEFEKMPGRVSSVVFNPDGSKFAATSSLDGKGEVRVYEVDSGKKVVCEKVTGPAYAVAWHPSGKTVASAGFDGKVWVHDAATGKLVREFTVMPTGK
jgi:WD40 repeat protein